MLKSIFKGIRKFLNIFGYEIVKAEDARAHQLGNWIEKLDIKTVYSIYQSYIAGKKNNCF